jgi:FkbM family methyltransferase
MLISFSQHNEDVILSEILQKDKGYYIDIGAHDPVHLSNTQLFYLKGWRGINVEPLPQGYERFKSLRGRDMNLKKLVGTKSGYSTLYEQVGSSGLSTTDKTVSDMHGSENVLLHDVETISLGELCRMAYSETDTIDFISIDVEGGELDVMQSDALSLCNPNYIILELNPWSVLEKRNEELKMLLEKKGYHSVYSNGINSFFTHKELEFKKIENIVSRVSFSIPENECRDMFWFSEHLNEKVAINAQIEKKGYSQVYLSEPDSLYIYDCSDIADLFYYDYNDKVQKKLLYNVKHLKEIQYKNCGVHYEEAQELMLRHHPEGHIVFDSIFSDMHDYFEKAVYNSDVQLILPKIVFHSDKCLDCELILLQDLADPLPIVSQYHDIGASHHDYNGE